MGKQTLSLISDCLVRVSVCETLILYPFFIIPYLFPAPDTPPRPRRHRISSRVHFPEDVHDPEIHVSRERDGGVDVNLGFLQVHHRYKCCFTVINSVAGEVDANCSVTAVIVTSLAAFPNQDGE